MTDAKKKILELQTSMLKQLKDDPSNMAFRGSITLAASLLGDDETALYQYGLLIQAGHREPSIIEAYTSALEQTLAGGNHDSFEAHRQTFEGSFIDCPQLTKFFAQHKKLALSANIDDCSIA